MKVLQSSKIKITTTGLLVIVSFIVLSAILYFIVVKVKSFQLLLNSPKKSEYPTEQNIVAKNCDNNHGRTNLEDVSNTIFIMSDVNSDWVMNYHDLPVELPEELLSQIAFLKTDAIPCDPKDSVELYNNNKGTFSSIRLSAEEFVYQPYEVREHKMSLLIPISDTSEKVQTTFLSLELSRSEPRILNAELLSIRYFQKDTTVGDFYVVLSSSGSKILPFDDYADYIQRLNTKLAPVLIKYYTCEEVEYLTQCNLHNVPQLLLEIETEQNNTVLKSSLLKKMTSDEVILSQIKLRSN